MRPAIAVRLLLMLAGKLSVLFVSAAFAQTAFYSIANSDIASSHANGALIRSEAIYGAPDGASSYRVLYRSEGLYGEPIAVSSVVIVPAGLPPPGVRAISAELAGETVSLREIIRARNRRRQETAVDPARS